MVNLRFDWVVTSAKMHLNLIVRFFFFQLALFTSYRNAPWYFTFRPAGRGLTAFCPHCIWERLCWQEDQIGTSGISVFNKL